MYLSSSSASCASARPLPPTCVRPNALPCGPTRVEHPRKCRPFWVRFNTLHGQDGPQMQILIFGSSIRTAWEQHHVVQPRAPKQPYITHSTCQLIAIRKAHRQYLHSEDRELRKVYLKWGLADFSLARTGREASAHARARLSQSLRALHGSFAQAIAVLDRTGAAVRRAVCKDRVQYLASLQLDITLADLRGPKRLYSLVRRAFPARVLLDGPVLCRQACDHCSRAA